MNLAYEAYTDMKFLSIYASIYTNILVWNFLYIYPRACRFIRRTQKHTRIQKTKYADSSSVQGSDAVAGRDHVDNVKWCPCLLQFALGTCGGCWWCTLCVCVCVWLCVCVCVCLCVCVCVSVCLPAHKLTCVCVCWLMGACVCICTHNTTRVLVKAQTHVGAYMYAPMFSVYIPMHWLSANYNHRHRFSVLGLFEEKRPNTIEKIAPCILLPDSGLVVYKYIS